ncbi:MAG TPA: hypothetical protein VE093_10150, partial [Polyangiaceae bacterium]|nr:hypothetical protein [Polyangiaceae bacterium]
MYDALRCVSGDTSLDRGEVRRGPGRALGIQREGLLKKEGARVVLEETFVRDGEDLPVLSSPLGVDGEPVVVNGELFPVLSSPLVVDGEPVVVDGEPVPVLSSPLVVDGEPIVVDGEPVVVDGEPVPVV